MAQHTGQGPTPSASGAPPSPSELLRAALEKIVFFEWRLGELAAELAAAQSRAAAGEVERLRAEEHARTAQVQAQAARLSLAELEAERARLAALLARPAHAAQTAQADGAALEAERQRCARLEAELADARREIERQRAERERWLSEMIEQARAGGEAPNALAEFISELRGEVIMLRERQKQTDVTLAQAGLPAAPPSNPPPRAEARGYKRDDAAVEDARALWAQGRLGGARGEQDVAHAAATIAAPRESAAARALAEQCLRGLQSSDAARRAQAAAHLAAVPSGAAAPVVAHALGVETDAKAKAALVRAVIACGGDGAAGLALGLLAPDEPALVRLAAVEALAAAGGDRARAALEAGARDPSAAVRRRTASLLMASADGAELLAVLARDADASVRAACAIEAAAAAEPSAIAGPSATAAAPAQDVRLAAVPPTRIDPPRAPGRDLAAEAKNACRASIFGLTEAELADAIGIDAGAAVQMAQQLVASGALGRRGKRLVWRGETNLREERR